MPGGRTCSDLFKAVRKLSGSSAGSLSNSLEEVTKEIQSAFRFPASPIYINAEVNMLNMLLRKLSQSLGLRTAPLREGRTH